MPSVHATRLRAELYRRLDEVLETGEPLEIVRKGRRLHLTVAPGQDARPMRRRLIPHPDAIVGDPDELVQMDWSPSWKPSI